MKLHIIIEASEHDINQIAEQLSDGGGEEVLNPFIEEEEKYLKFDYTKCFPGWGYDPAKDGPDKTVTVTVESEPFTVEPD